MQDDINLFQNSHLRAVPLLIGVKKRSCRRLSPPQNFLHCFSTEKISALLVCDPHSPIKKVKWFALKQSFYISPETKWPPRDKGLFSRVSDKEILNTAKHVTSTSPLPVQNSLETVYLRPMLWLPLQDTLVGEDTNPVFAVFFKRLL